MEPHFKLRGGTPKPMKVDISGGGSRTNDEDYKLNIKLTLQGEFKDTDDGRAMLGDKAMDIVGVIKRRLPQSDKEADELFKLDTSADGNENYISVKVNRVLAGKLAKTIKSDPHVSRGLQSAAVGTML